jgi:hypothetical protein
MNELRNAASVEEDAAADFKTRPDAKALWDQSQALQKSSRAAEPQSGRIAGLQSRRAAWRQDNRVTGEQSGHAGVVAGQRGRVQADINTSNRARIQQRTQRHGHGHEHGRLQPRFAHLSSAQCS